MTDKKKLELISGYVQKCYHESYYDMSNAIADIANILESETINPVPSIPIVGGGSVASDRTEPGGSGQSAEDVESIFYKRCDIARCDGASIEYLTKPNAIKAMHTYASQVCAGKDEIIKERELEILSLTYDKDKEIDRLNESLIVLLRKNADLEKEIVDCKKSMLSAGMISGKDAEKFTKRHNISIENIDLRKIENGYDINNPKTK